MSYVTVDRAGRGIGLQSETSDGLSSLMTLAFDVAREVIQDRLPAALLLLNGVSRFGVKDNSDIDAVRDFHELNLCRPVSQGILNLCRQ